MVTRGEGEGGGIDWEVGIDIYTLLYLKQTTRKEKNNNNNKINNYMGLLQTGT